MIGLDSIFAEGNAFAEEAAKAIVSRVSKAADGVEFMARVSTLAAISRAKNAPIELHPSPFEWSDPKNIAPRDWLYGRHLIRRHVSATIASGAVGKTSLKIVEALAMASGRSLLGKEVPIPLSVWLFNLEDDEVELRRRVTAAMAYHGVKPSDVAGRLYIDSEKTLLITETTREGTKIKTPVVDAMIRAVKARNIDVLIVDPLISSHDAPESDSGAMDRIMKSGWVVVARDGNCAVELCHHTTKEAGANGLATAMSGRGSGAVVFACRSVQVLNPMTLQQSQTAALPSPQGYFCATDDKQNLTLKSGHLDWYKMASVPLGNGGPGNFGVTKQDQIGVATRWYWPSKASFVQDITDAQLIAIQDAIGTGEYRKDAQSPAWAGYAVADVLGLGGTKETLGKTDQLRVKKMVDAWIQQAVFRVVKKRDPTVRQDKEFIVLAEGAPPRNP